MIIKVDKKLFHHIVICQRKRLKTRRLDFHPWKVLPRKYQFWILVNRLKSNSKIMVENPVKFSRIFKELKKHDDFVLDHEPCLTNSWAVFWTLWCPRFARLKANVTNRTQVLLLGVGAEDRFDFHRSESGHIKTTTTTMCVMTWILTTNFGGLLIHQKSFLWLHWRRLSKMRDNRFFFHSSKR